MCAGLVGGVTALLHTPAAWAAPTIAAPAIPWTWSALPNFYPLVDLSARVRHQKFSLHEEVLPGKSAGSVATLTYELEKANLRTAVWKVTVPDPGHGELSGAAMVLTNTQIFVARYSRIATGCTLYAFAVENGILQWKVFLEGIGPIAHSKWYNRVQLSVVGNHPVVFGNEGPTRAYIEQRDAATGALLSNQKRDGVAAVQPLAEPLYAELQTMIRQQPTYQVTARDFVLRHGMNASVLAQLPTAVQQVDAQPVQFGRYVLAVQLQTLNNGEQVITAKRR